MDTHTVHGYLNKSSNGITKKKRKLQRKIRAYTQREHKRIEFIDSNAQNKKEKKLRERQKNKKNSTKIVQKKIQRELHRERRSADDDDDDDENEGVDAFA